MRRTLVTTLLSVFFLWSFISIGIVHNSSESRSENEREGGRNEAREALDFWTRARAYPNADIPADKYFQAYQLSKMKHNSLPTILTAGSVWDPLGPTNLHGRSLCAAVNPLNSNTIYLGTASGGLWRSYSDGLKADWQQVKLGYPALGISSIVIDPTDSKSIYVGTGEVY